MKSIFLAAVWLSAALFLTAAAGCGSVQPAGEYHAEAQVAPGREESRERGYSLAEMTAKLQASPQSLKLLPGGRYNWNTGSGVNEGTWRVEGQMIVFRDDISRGIRILPALQTDRQWRLGPDGEIINDSTFSRYNIEIVYRRR